MNLVLKIEAKGFCSSLNISCDSKLVIDVDADDFKKVLGEALYLIEKQGYGFVTSEIYEEVVQGYNDLVTLRKQYQKIYISDVLTVSLKLS